MISASGERPASSRPKRSISTSKVQRSPSLVRAGELRWLLGEERPRSARDLRVALAPRRVEERLDLSVIEPVDERRPAERRLPASLHDLARDPLQVLPRLVSIREHI